MKYFTLIICALFFVSCGTQKPIASKNEVKVEPTRSNHQQFYEAIGKKSSFDAVKISSKIDVELGKSIPSVDATIYIENQQKVWVNMSALFINMARGIATPQGIKAYEKIEKTYVDSDFSYLNNLLNINFLDYQTLQNLLIGKVFLPINEQDYQLNPTAGGFALKSKKGLKIGNTGKQSEYLVEWLFSKDFSLTKIELKEVNSPNQLEIHYENWQQFPSEKLPKNVKIIIKGKKNGQILIENTKFDFSKMETPYSVPKNYKKREF